MIQRILVAISAAAGIASYIAAVAGHDKATGIAAMVGAVALFGWMMALMADDRRQKGGAR